MVLRDFKESYNPNLLALRYNLDTMPQAPSRFNRYSLSTCEVVWTPSSGTDHLKRRRKCHVREVSAPGPEFLVRRKCLEFSK